MTRSSRIMWRSRMKFIILITCDLILLYACNCSVSMVLCYNSVCALTCRWCSIQYVALCAFICSGYVQGMSDMLAPILYVVDNEVDAFWCFAGLMDRMVSISSSLLSDTNIHTHVVIIRWSILSLLKTTLKQGLRSCALW